MPRRENGLMKSNVFDKPREEELALIPRRENGLMKSNVFVKPGAAMSERRGNLFPLPNESSVDEVNADELARMLKR